MSQHHWRRHSLSFSYSFTQVSLGLLIHPFQTMQMLVLDKYWLWLALLPAAIFLAGFLIWQLIWLFVFRLFAPAPPELYPAMGFALRLGKWWFSYFCLLWQTILALLFIKFYFFYRNKLEK